MMIRNALKCKYTFILYTCISKLGQETNKNKTLPQKNNLLQKTACRVDGNKIHLIYISPVLLVLICYIKTTTHNKVL